MQWLTGWYLGNKPDRPMLRKIAYYTVADIFKYNPDAEIIADSPEHLVIYNKDCIFQFENNNDSTPLIHYYNTQLQK